MGGKCTQQAAPTKTPKGKKKALLLLLHVLALPLVV
jgi:hypothetical protein